MRAQKILCNAPSKDQGFTVVVAVNDDRCDAAKHRFLSNDSCTTNWLPSAAKILLETFGVEPAVATVGDQNLLEMPRAGSTSEWDWVLPTALIALGLIGWFLPRFANSRVPPIGVGSEPQSFMRIARELRLGRSPTAGWVAIYVVLFMAGETLCLLGSVILGVRAHRPLEVLAIGLFFIVLAAIRGLLRAPR